MAEKRRQFTREFKLEAVRMVSSGERKVRELAKDREAGGEDAMGAAAVPAVGAELSRTDGERAPRARADRPVGRLHHGVPGGHV